MARGELPHHQRGRRGQRQDAQSHGHDTDSQPAVRAVEQTRTKHPRRQSTHPPSHGANSTPIRSQTALQQSSKRKREASAKPPSKQQKVSHGDAASAKQSRTSNDNQAGSMATSQVSVAVQLHHANQALSTVGRRETNRRLREVRSQVPSSHQKVGGKRVSNVFNPKKKLIQILEFPFLALPREAREKVYTWTSIAYGPKGLFKLLFVHPQIYAEVVPHLYKRVTFLVTGQNGQVTTGQIAFFERKCLSNIDLDNPMAPEVRNWDVVVDVKQYDGDNMFPRTVWDPRTDPEPVGYTPSAQDNIFDDFQQAKKCDGLIMEFPGTPGKLAKHGKPAESGKNPVRFVTTRNNPALRDGLDPVHLRTNDIIMNKLVDLVMRNAKNIDSITLRFGVGLQKIAWHKKNGPPGTVPEAQFLKHYTTSTLDCLLSLRNIKELGVSKDTAVRRSIWYSDPDLRSCYDNFGKHVQTNIKPVAETRGVVKVDALRTGLHLEALGDSFVLHLTDSERRYAPEKTRGIPCTPTTAYYGFPAVVHEALESIRHLSKHTSPASIIKLRKVVLDHAEKRLQGIYEARDRYNDNPCRELLVEFHCSFTSSFPRMYSKPPFRPSKVESEGFSEIEGQELNSRAKDLKELLAMDLKNHTNDYKYGVLTERSLKDMNDQLKSIEKIFYQVDRDAQNLMSVVPDPNAQPASAIRDYSASPIDLKKATAKEIHSAWLGLLRHTYKSKDFLRFEDDLLERTPTAVQGEETEYEAMKRTHRQQLVNAGWAYH